MIGAMLAGLCAGCSTDGVRGAADDGEQFTGYASQTGFTDLSGHMTLKGDRGTLCTGVWKYPGVFAGPSSRGTATVTCTGGQSGEFLLVGNGPGKGEGYIGPRKVTFTF